MADGKVKIDVIVDDNNAEKKLNDIEDAAEDAGKNLEDLGDGAGEGSKGLGLLDIAAGNLVSGGIQSLISGIGNAIQSLVSLADETREFREDMAKLETAFKDTGHAPEDATKAYEDFYAILGESDRSVEAVNHLAELTKNTEELSQWSTICAGVTAKFGDSLPIEGLTEAANETAKVGQVTGPLADALNWAGISEEKFNEELKKCNSEQERATLITKTLNDEYSAAAAEYNTLTASAQEARRATAQMEASQARLGAALEPLSIITTEAKTAFYDFAATLAEGVTAGIEQVKERMTGLNSEQRLLIENAYEAGESLLRIRESSAIAADGINAQFDYTQKLADELFRLSDANGFVEDNERARVDFILGELSAALGTEYTLIGNTISQYDNLKNSIEGTIAAERARLLLAEYQEVYVEAVRASAEQETAINTQREAMYQSLEAAEKARSEEKIARIEYEKAVEAGANSHHIRLLGEKLTAAETATRNQELLYERQKKELEKLEGEHAESTKTINAYEEAKTAILSGETDKAIGILNNYDAAMKGSTDVVLTENQKQEAAAREKVVNTSVQLALLEAKYKKSYKTMTDAQREEMEKRIADAKKEAQDAMSEAEAIGGNLSKGLEKGVNDEWTLTGTLSKLVGDAITAAKKKAGIKSPSRVMRDEVGEMIVLGLAEGIADNGHKAVDALADLSEKTIREAKKGAAEQIKVLEDEIKALDEKRTDANKKQIDEQKKTLQKELDIFKEKEKALTSYASTYEKQLGELVKLEESYVADVGKLQEQLAKDTEAAQKRYDDAFARRVESIKSGLSLFDKAEKGDSVKGTDLIKNLKSQNDVLENYNKALDELSGKGINQAFVDELMGMGVDALPQLEAINKMTDKQLEEYVGLWEEKNKLATEAATDELATMRKETDAEIIRLREDATDEFFKLTDTYKESFVKLSEDIAIGMEEAGGTGLEVLGNQLTEYTNMGVAMMDGLINGIESKEGMLAQQMEHVIKNAIHAAKMEAGIHSPSKVMADEVGANLGLGTLEGWKSKVSAIKKAMVSDMSGLTANLRASVMAENSRFATNTGAPDTGFADLARAVGVQTAGINSLAGEYRRGSGTTRPIIIELNGRELGHAFVDTGGTETVRIGSKISLGGAKG